MHRCRWLCTQSAPARRRPFPLPLLNNAASYKSPARPHGKSPSSGLFGVYCANDERSGPVDGGGVEGCEVERKLLPLGDRGTDRLSQNSGGIRCPVVVERGGP